MGRAQVTREQWLDEGLESFGRHGLAGLKVEAMASRLGSSKAGFYWYFKTRAGFEKALFEHWRAQETQRIIAAAETEGSPADKILRMFMEVIQLRRSADFLFHLRRLAQKRRSLARLLEQIENERLSYVASVLAELGKDPSDAMETAEAMYHQYLGWYERNQFQPLTQRELRKQLRVASLIVGLDLEARKGTTS
jgi:AcrR family transcriptional regulator